MIIIIDMIIIIVVIIIMFISIVIVIVTVALRPRASGDESDKVAKAKRLLRSPSVRADYYGRMKTIM